jgi:Flp pilus assembly protein TadD
VAFLRTLADRYRRAADWPNALLWQGRLVAARPTDTDARLILGAYHFNADDLAAAEREWLEVVRQNPRSAEAMYDLGFLYWASTPPDEARAQAVWQRVVEIDRACARSG